MILHYNCDKCDHHRDLKYLPRKYKLGDDQYVMMSQRHVWCDECHEISVAESLELEKSYAEHLETSLSELRELKDNPPKDLSGLRRFERSRIERAADTIRDIEGELRRWDEWRNLRKSPAKCLKCGNTNFDIPDSETASIIHGGCGGTLLCTMTISSFNGPATYAHIYNAEGELLELGKKPRLVQGSLQPEYIELELFVNETSIPNGMQQSPNK